MITTAERAWTFQSSQKFAHRIICDGVLNTSLPQMRLAHETRKATVETIL